jgi:hypothetical protein
MKYHVSLAVLRISLIYSVSVAVRCVNKIILFYICFFRNSVFYICDSALGVHYCAEVGFKIIARNTRETSVSSESRMSRGTQNTRNSV